MLKSREVDFVLFIFRYVFFHEVGGKGIEYASETHKYGLVLLVRRARLG